MSPALAPRRCSSSSGDDRRRADLVEVVVGGEARRCGSPSREPAMSMVTLSPSAAGALDALELGELVAQPVDLGVDLLVGRPRAAGSSTRRLVVAGDRDRRAAPRRRRRRRPAPSSSPAVMSISGGGDDVDVVLARPPGRSTRAARRCSASLAGRPSVPMRASRTRAGRLAGPEPGDADLAGDASGRRRRSPCRTRPRRPRRRA